METQPCRSLNRILIICALYLAAMTALAYTQEKLLGPNRQMPESFGQPSIPDRMPPELAGDAPMAGRQQNRGISIPWPEGEKDAVRELLQPEIRKQLSITDEQVRTLEDIRFNCEKEKIQHNATLQIARMELLKIIDSDNVDRGLVEKKVMEVAQEEASLLRTSINGRINARLLLNADQRRKLSKLLQNQMNNDRAPIVHAGPRRPGIDQMKERMSEAGIPVKMGTE